MGFRIGVDIGGTFTDFILADARGRLREAKVPSRPVAPGEALREGIGLLAEQLGSSREELLVQCDMLIHGTTVATNALIQRRGARTGLLCTSGFRDTLHMREGYKENRYDFRYPPPPDLVPRRLRLPVAERVAPSGEVLIPLAEDQVREHARTFAAGGVEAIAVCFLWSFANQAHERRAGEIVREELPGPYLSLSVDVLPEIREYDRVSTTVLNAFLGPVVVRYVDEIEHVLRSLGYRGPIRYMQSNGGLTSGEAMKRRPVLALNSGPAAAPSAGRFFGRAVGAEDVLTIDMGGTSFDVCLLDKGVPTTIKNVEVGRCRVGTPMVEVNAIGAGGGSIARADAGLLRVGPESAEAAPGPVCYGKGGTEPTVCDADVSLGYLNPTHLLGGRFPLDRAAAEAAIDDRIARPLGLELSQAARAIFSLVNQNMVNAIREVSIERGYDPRDFTLIIGGGCGPVHAVSLARELGIRRVVVPKVASTLCAFGALVADMRHEYGTSYVRRFEDVRADELEEIFRRLEERALADLAEEGVAPDRTELKRVLEMRYRHQVHECTVELPSRNLTDNGLAQVEELFHRRNETLFTYAERDQPTEVITARLAASAANLLVLGHAGGRNGADAPPPQSERAVFWETLGEFVSTPVYAGEELRPGMTLHGPAIVEETNTTVVVPPAVTLSREPDAYVLEVPSMAGR
jgi:N-methylhydantoinase A